jgi:hypothetical protein
MNRTTRAHGKRIAALAAMTIVVSGAALANRGGGDSGDSSMNPFTGDSYAYFHGGHNLGEEGTIRPNRVPGWRPPVRHPEVTQAPRRDDGARYRPDEAGSDAAPDRRRER